jgi:hypothetical protein
MAVAFDGTRWADADADPDTLVGGDWQDSGGGAPALEADFVYQRAAGTNGAISEQVKGAELGVGFVPTVTVDLTTPRKLHLKCIISTSSVLSATVGAGAEVEIGSGGRRSAWYSYYVAYGLGTDPEYPVRGGWLLLAIDPNQAAFRDLATGAPALGSVNWIGFVATMTVTSAKTQNLAMDAIEYVPSAKGLTWTGAAGTFQSFVDYDEGTFTNRYGIISTSEGIIYSIAMLTVGSAVATTFSDTNKVVIWPWQRVGAGAQGLYIDLQNAASTADFTTCIFRGNGKECFKHYFDTTSLVISDANDTVTLGENHEYASGDYVLYSREGGADNIGLTDATYYWVNAASTTAVSFHATRAAAIAGTSKVALTAQGAPGENHSILRNPDNRIDFTFSGTAGLATLTSCIIAGVRALALTSAVTVSGGFIQSIGNIVLSTANLSGVTFQLPTLKEGDALFDPVTASMTTLQNNIFNAGSEGHAIRITSNANSPFTSNNEYNNYWAPETDGWNFHTQTGVDPATDVITTDAGHGFTTGDAVYYNNEGGGDSVGLTNGNKYYVRVITASTVSMHVTKAAAVNNSSLVALSDGAAGQTHSLYSSKATIFNDSGAAITINVTTGTDSPSVRNGTSATTTISSSVPLFISCVNEAGFDLEGIRVRIETTGGTLITDGTTDINGEFSDTYGGGTPQAVNVIARLKGYKNNKTTTSITAAGLSVPFTMIRDQAVNMP